MVCLFTPGFTVAYQYTIAYTQYFPMRRLSHRRSLWSFLTDPFLEDDVPGFLRGSQTCREPENCCAIRFVVQFCIVLQDGVRNLYFAIRHEVLLRIRVSL
jgi:hypothetical protein